MKAILKITAVTLGLILVGMTGSAFAVTDNTSTAHDIKTPRQAYPCMTFRLDGVTEADGSVLAGEQYYGVPTTHFAYDEIYRVLLLARAMDSQVRVVTSGSIACGYYVEVRDVSLP